MNGRRRTMAGATLVGVVAVVLLILRLDTGERIDDQSIVLLGDSITSEGDWSALFPAAPVVNQGYSGFTTAQLKPIASDVAEHRPRMLFVLTGTNDIRDSRPPSWTIRHLKELLDVVATESPQTAVVLQTVLPRADRVLEVSMLNDAIRELATERGLGLLETYEDFDNGRGGLRRDETSDGIHLTSAGYTRWTNLLRPLIDPAS